VRPPTIVELRQYRLVPGKRDVLIDLFEANLVEPQEAAGMTVIGTFRDLDDPSKFVWLRGFPTMGERARSLAAFYGGPVWRRHRDAANTTMVDSENVLLLRPARAESGFAVDAGANAGGDPGIVEAAVLSLEAAAGAHTLAHFDEEIEPVIAAAGGATLAVLVTDPSENSFPALPVREGENVFVYVSGFPDRDSYETTRAGSLRAAARTPRLVEPPQLLRLAPTRRSRLSGISRPRIETGATT